MKRIIKATVAIAASFLAGYGTSSYLQKNLASSIGVATGGALISGSLVWLLFDTKITRQRNELQNRIETNKRKLDTLKTENTALHLTIQDTNARINQLIAEALVTEDKLTVVSQNNSDYRQQLASLDSEIKILKDTLKNVECQRDEFKITADFKENQMQHFENTFHEELQNKSEQNYQSRFKQELAQEESQHFILLQESEQIVADMNDLLNEVYSRHQSQKFYTENLSDKFLQFKADSDDKNQSAYDALLGEKDLLETEVLKLNSKIANGLTQPVYTNYGIESLQGKVIHRIIEWVYRILEIPLRGLDFEDSDGLVSFGVDYPKQSDPKSICQAILDNSHNIKVYLGIHSLDRAEYISKYDAIVISYRHAAPKPESDDDIYKSGLIPAPQFADVVYKAINCENAKAKPTMRVMAATGEGKGIAMKNLLVGLTEQEVEVWLSDPVDGDDFDFWDCPKVARSKKEAGIAYAHFVKTHKDRTGTKNNTRLIAVFDEFDKKHDDDDKETAKNLMTDIRHTNMVQILIGQAAEVGLNRWTWDDMKNCSLLVLGDSIGTLCKHLVKDFGWTTAKANKVKSEKERYEKWAEAKNTPDIPNENAYRIGLLVNGGSYQFVEIPSAYKGTVKNSKGLIRESLIGTTHTAQASLPQENVKPVIKCPKCDSSAHKLNGKDKATKTIQQYICKDCGKGYNQKTGIY